MPPVGWVHGFDSLRRPAWRRAAGAPWPAPLPARPRFLVHQARYALGDALWLTPLLGEIGRRWPGGRAVVVAPARVEAVLASHPAVERFVACSERPTAAERRAVDRALDEHPPDAALFAFARRPEATRLLAAAADRAVPFRVNLEIRDPDLDSRVVAPAATHEAWLLWGTLPSPRFLLHALDPFLPPDAPSPRSRHVEYRPPAEAHAAAAARLAEWGLAGSPFAVLAPGGRSSPRWPAESYAALAGALTERGLHVVIAGAPEETALVDAVAAAAPRAHRRAVASLDPVPVLAALLARARLLVGNDSAPIHLAEAAGTPTLYVTRAEKRVHSHPAGAACWALWDAAANDPAAIAPARLLAALDAMAAAGLVALPDGAPLAPRSGSVYTIAEVNVQRSLSS